MPLEKIPISYCILLLHVVDNVDGLNHGSVCVMTVHPRIGPFVIPAYGSGGSGTIVHSGAAAAAAAAEEEGVFVLSRMTSLVFANAKRRIVSLFHRFGSGKYTIGEEMTITQHSAQGGGARLSGEDPSKWWRRRSCTTWAIYWALRRGLRRRWTAVRKQGGLKLWTLPLPPPPPPNSSSSSDVRTTCAPFSLA